MTRATTVVAIILLLVAGAPGALPPALLAEIEQSPPPPLLPRAAFIPAPIERSAILAPDSERVAYVVTESTGSSVWELDIGDGTSRQLAHVDEVRDVAWSADANALFVQTPTGVAVVGLTGGRPALIARLDPASDQFYLAVDAAHPAAVLISEPSGDGHRLTRSTASGERIALLATTQRVHAVLPDAGGRPRFIRQVDGDELIVRDLAAADHGVLLRCHFLDACELLHHDIESDRLLLVTSHDDDLRRLAWLSLADGRLHTLHRDPQGIAGIADVQLSTDGRPLVVSYYTDRLRHYGLTPAVQSRLDLLAERFPDADVWLDARSELGPWLLRVRRSTLDHEQAMVLTGDDRLLPVPTGNRGMLDSRDLSPKLPVSWIASDGMRLHGYLTLPRGVPAAAAPLVVKVHGGPWNRVTAAFDAQTQFLVNRGYAVFEPNFRASTGYGMAYVTSAAGDFGDGRVQQDITDGVHWLLQQGIGDADRVAIIGHSFGGFSALAGLAFTPDLYRAGFAGAPPSDLVRSTRLMAEQEEVLLNGVPMNRLLRALLVDVDDPAAVARLSARSPREHLAAIQAPLAIWAGGRDTRVDVREVKHLALTLQAAGKPVSLLVDPTAGHSPRTDLQHLAYLHQLEAVLGGALGGRRETPLDDRLGRYLEAHEVFDLVGACPETPVFGSSTDP